MEKRRGERGKGEGIRFIMARAGSCLLPLDKTGHSGANSTDRHPLIYGTRFLRLVPLNR